MKVKKGVLTNKMLDELYKKLCEEGGQPTYDENGRPVCTLSFYGTKEECEAMKKKLLEIKDQ